MVDGDFCSSTRTPEPAQIKFFYLSVNAWTRLAIGWQRPAPRKVSNTSKLEKSAHSSFGNDWEFMSQKWGGGTGLNKYFHSFRPKDSLHIWVGNDWDEWNIHPQPYPFHLFLELGNDWEWLGMIGFFRVVFFVLLALDTPPWLKTVGRHWRGSEHTAKKIF